MQRIFAWPYRAILAFLLWTRIRPYQLTLISLVLAGVAGWQILVGNWVVAGILLLIGGIADVFD